MAGLWDDRLAEVWAAPGNAGAGVVVGDVGVLTAHHLVAEVPPGGRILARVVRPGVSTASWAPMRIAFVGDDWDIAILILDDTEAGHEMWAVPRSPSPVFARLGKVAERNCETVGFPRSAAQVSGLAPSAVVRQSEHAVGTVLPAGHGKPSAQPHPAFPLALMPLDVDTAAPLAQADWSGMSGAGVILPDERLIGLIVQAEAGHQHRRLYMVPLAEALDRDPGLRSVVEFMAAPLIIEPRDASRYRNALKAQSLGADGVPLRINQVTDLGVFGVRSADLPSEPKYLIYAARDGDADLERHLADALIRQRMLLIVGDSAAGKSRSAAEAARRVLPDHRLLCPRARDLSAIAKLPLAELMPAVVWLDDVDLFTHHEGLREDLQQVLKAGVPVIATVRRAALEQLTSPGGMRNPNGEALCNTSLIDRVDWPSKWNPEEYARIADKVSNPDLLRAIEDGIPVGVYCVAGPELLRRVKEASLSEDMPWRYALIIALLDWYRTGIGVPAPLAVIEEFMPKIPRIQKYPYHLEVEGDPLKEDIDDALRWFTANVTGGRGRQSQQRVITLLDADGGPASLSVHDYIRDHDHQEDRKLPDEVWFAALRSAPDDEAVFRVAVAADKQDRTDISLSAMTPLADKGYALAMCNVSAMLIGNDPESARNWAERALQSGDEGAIPYAQNNLGVILARSGDWQAAEPPLDAAVSSAGPEVLPIAQANLGGVLVNLGNIAAARPLLEAALSSGNPRAVLLAQANLGVLLVLLGDTERAKPLLDAAVGSGDLQVVPIAQAGLAGLLMTSWDLEGARPLLEAAISSGDPQVLPIAQTSLGALLAASGDTEGARSLLGAAVSSGNPLARLRAQAGLGVLLATSGELEEARPVLEAVVRSGHPLAAPIAQAGLGAIRMMSGDTEEAKLLLEAAVDSRDPQAVPIAQLGLGQLLMASKDMVAAKPFLLSAASSGHPLIAPVAQAELALLLMLSGDVAAGMLLLAVVSRSGNPKAVELARTYGEVIGLDLSDVGTSKPAESTLPSMEPLSGQELSAAVIRALQRGVSRVYPGEPLDTKNLFIALEESDSQSEWQRLWLETGDVEFRASLDFSDPEPGSSGNWNGVPLTGTCTRSLQVAVLIATAYGLRPVPIGTVALGLAADPNSGAARMLMIGSLNHSELIELLQEITLGMTLNKIEDLLVKAIPPPSAD